MHVVCFPSYPSLHRNDLSDCLPDDVLVSVTSEVSIVTTRNEPPAFLQHRRCQITFARSSAQVSHLKLAMVSYAEVKSYLSKREIPQLFESLMAGLMYHRPENHISYLQCCLEELKSSSGESRVQWNMFVNSKKRKSKETLPPLTPKKQESVSWSSDSRQSTPLPPISARSRAMRTAHNQGPFKNTYLLYHNPPPVLNPPNVPVIFALGGSCSRIDSLCEEVVSSIRGVVHISASSMLKTRMVIEGFYRMTSIPACAVVDSVLQAMSMVKSAKALLVAGFPRNRGDVEEYRSRRVRVDGAILVDFEEDALRRFLLTEVESGLIKSSEVEYELDRYKQDLISVAEYYDEKEILTVVMGDQHHHEVVNDMVTAVDRIIENRAESSLDEDIPDEKTPPPCIANGICDGTDKRPPSRTSPGTSGVILPAVEGSEGFERIQQAQSPVKTENAAPNGASVPQGLRRDSLPPLAGPSGVSINTSTAETSQEQPISLEAPKSDSSDKSPQDTPRSKDSNSGDISQEQIQSTQNDVIGGKDESEPKSPEHSEQLSEHISNTEQTAKTGDTEQPSEEESAVEEQIETVNAKDHPEQGSAAEEQTETDSTKDLLEQGKAAEEQTETDNAKDPSEQGSVAEEQTETDSTKDLLEQGKAAEEQTETDNAKDPSEQGSVAEEQTEIANAKDHSEQGSVAEEQTETDNTKDPPEQGSAAEEQSEIDNAKDPSEQGSVDGEQTETSNTKEPSEQESVGEEQIETDNAKEPSEQDSISVKEAEADEKQPSEQGSVSHGEEITEEVDSPNKATESLASSIESSEQADASGSQPLAEGESADVSQPLAQSDDVDRAQEMTDKPVPHRPEPSEPSTTSVTPESTDTSLLFPRNKERIVKSVPLVFTLDHVDIPKDLEETLTSQLRVNIIRFEEVIKSHFYPADLQDALLLLRNSMLWEQSSETKGFLIRNFPWELMKPEGVDDFASLGDVVFLTPKDYKEEGKAIAMGDDIIYVYFKDKIRLLQDPVGRSEEIFSILEEIVTANNNEKQLSVDTRSENTSIGEESPEKDASQVDGREDDSSHLEQEEAQNKSLMSDGSTEAAPTDPASLPSDQQSDSGQMAESTEGDHESESKKTEGGDNSDKAENDVDADTREQQPPDLPSEVDKNPSEGQDVVDTGSTHETQAPSDGAESDIAKKPILIRQGTFSAVQKPDTDSPTENSEPPVRSEEESKPQEDGGITEETAETSKGEEQEAADSSQATDNEPAADPNPEEDQTISESQDSIADENSEQAEPKSDASGKESPNEPNETTKENESPTHAANGTDENLSKPLTDSEEQSQSEAQVSESVRQPVQNATEDAEKRTDSPSKTADSGTISGAGGAEQGASPTSEPGSRSSPAESDRKDNQVEEATADEASVQSEKNGEPSSEPASQPVPDEPAADDAPSPDDGYDENDDSENSECKFDTDPSDNDGPHDEEITKDGCLGQRPFISSSSSQDNGAKDIEVEAEVHAAGSSDIKDSHTPSTDTEPETVIMNKNFRPEGIESTAEESEKTDNDVTDKTEQLESSMESNAALDTNDLSMPTDASSEEHRKEMTRRMVEGTPDEKSGGGDAKAEVRPEEGQLDSLTSEEMCSIAQLVQMSSDGTKLDSHAEDQKDVESETKKTEDSEIKTSGNLLNVDKKLEVPVSDNAVYVLPDSAKSATRSRGSAYSGKSIDRNGDDVTNDPQDDEDQQERSSSSSRGEM